MGKRQEQAEPVRLQSARGRFLKWRKTRRGSSRIPESLWKLATRLGVEYGVARTAKALSLGYADLKKRVNREQDGRKSTTKAASFIEVPFSGTSISECSVELENISGSRLRVVLKGGVCPDISELVQIFYRGKA